MPTLASELRNKLERVIIEAREAAEAGARNALEALAVHYHEPYPHMNPAQRSLRNHLRARARQLGDLRDSTGRLAIDHLVGECAYEHWHRMLFARFLAENNLLIEPQENMAISLAEAEELAKEVDVGVWVFASRCAQGMLPQIFRPDDPLLQVPFAAEHLVRLEKLLASLPQAVFTASDALGWVYQFWQSKKKNEVNRSEIKIGADEIAAVTQLFTEPYMVEFLLHNTLGAWWAGKKLTAKDAASAKGEDELRRKLALPGVGWEYLRFVRGAGEDGGPWKPAAGRFDGWPKAPAELRVLDPCCGSGHFLVAVLHNLVPIRIAEENLSAAEAIDAVLHDNVYGMEIDERCCQIAAFALAFAAWTYPNAGGYRSLPDLHIACTGIGPQATEEQWLKLAEQLGMPKQTGECERVKNGLLNLHRLFSQAPTLGSLISPGELQADVYAADFETIQPYLAAIVSAEKADDETHERAVAAAGMAKAADLLSREYTLIITNVPYLLAGKMNPYLKLYVEEKWPTAKNDLAFAMLLRWLDGVNGRGTVALVLPNSFLFMSGYKGFRELLLNTYTIDSLARLGPRAFPTISGEIVRVALLTISRDAPQKTHAFAEVPIDDQVEATEKALQLRLHGIDLTNQLGQLQNPESRFVIGGHSGGERLGEYADSYIGLQTSDNPRFCIYIWEVGSPNSIWSYLQTPTETPLSYGGRDSLLRWENGAGELQVIGQIKGTAAWGKQGISVRLMSDLPPSLYDGAIFEQSSAAIIPKKAEYLPAIWCYCLSDEFRAAVRRIDQAIKITNKTFEKIDFDFAQWNTVSREKYPEGLPEPESDGPTQWLFHGRLEESTAPLQVAVARLLGYRWPAELDDKIQLSNRARVLAKHCDELARFADLDGIVCIPSVRGEEPAAERLLALLGTAGVNPEKTRELAGRADLDDWLRNDFFEEHCRLFHNRPFIWHIWDGRKRDGFHALVNYHKLCESGSKGRKLLESVTYSYLGDWITRQKDGVQRGEGGAEDRLAAASELKKRLGAILEGEPPFDLFVRWKPLAEQSIGWEPDINDGVRVNIRPFLTRDLPAGRTGAGVLRNKPNIKWTKDRGKEPQRPKAEYPWFWGWDETTIDFMGNKTFDGNRHNDCHYTNKVKQAAREATKGTKRG
jgi:hypothetical protein